MPEYPLMRAWRLFCRRPGTYTVNDRGDLLMKNNLFKRIVGACLAIVMMFSTSVSTFANGVNTHVEKNTFDKSQIMQLEPYITAENGFYEFDSEKAIEDGFSEELVYGQKAYLDKLNNEVKQGNITISSDLEITTFNDVNTPTLFRSCPGRNTSAEYHWWGYSIVNAFNFFAKKKNRETQAFRLAEQKCRTMSQEQ